MIHAATYAIFIACLALQCWGAAPGDKCDLINGRGYRGCDLGVTKEGSWEECAAECNKYSFCRFWTWEHQHSTNKPFTCWKHYGKCGTYINANVLSGNADCGKKYVWCQPAYGRHYECKQEPIKTIPDVPTWQQCAGYCGGIPGCAFWTWNHDAVITNAPSTCSLMAAGTCKLRPKYSSISGDQKCQQRCSN
eukprot:TCONS_00065463-protein